MNNIIDSVSSLTLGQITQYLVVIIGVLSVLIEKSKKLPFNPWSTILSSLGNKLNKNLISDLEEIKKQTEENKKAVELVNQKMEEQEIEADTKEAKRLRAEIIDYADSCQLHQMHTQSQYEEFVRKVSDYVSYCNKRNIPNHFIDSEVEYVTSVFNECVREGRFVEVNKKEELK